MTTEAVLALALAVFVLTIKPGPGMMLVISRTISQGMPACFAVLLGAQLVNMVFLAIVFAGFTVVNVDIVFISIIIKTLAAVYLIWMGIQGLRDTASSFRVREFGADSFFDSMSASMILTASNPLVIIFYAGVLPTILDVNAINFIDMLTIALVIIIVEAGTAALYCLPFALFQYKIQEHLLRRIQIFSSLVIICIGLYIGYSALPAQELLALF